MWDSKLKDSEVRAAEPREKMYKKADGHGLSLEVRPNGKKYWRYQFKVNGKRSTIGLGVYPEVSLSKAREAHKKAYDQVSEGLNPVLERQKEEALKGEQASNTFGKVALEWIDHERGTLSKNQSTKIQNWIKRDMFPTLGGRPIAEIVPMDVLAAIKAIEKRGALDVAKRQRAIVERIFNYAIQTGRAINNPAISLKGVVRTERVVHRLALDRDGLGPFLNKLDEFDRVKMITRLALKLLILTAARPGEVRGALWPEFDMDKREWRIPAERMKMGTEHVIPLSDQAIEIVTQIKQFSWNSPYLFPSDRDAQKVITENALCYVMQRMGYKGIATPHGFRSTFSTIANEEGFRSDVIEKQLAHEQRNKVKKAYNRALYLKEGREMMQWWADYLDTVKSGANVLPFKRAVN